MYGNRLKVSESSPRLIIHCLNSCQKKVDISQFKNKWMRVSLSFLQKVHCSPSVRFILVRKMLVASLLCSSLNWNTINLEIFVWCFGHASCDPFSLASTGFFCLLFLRILYVSLFGFVDFWKV